MLIQERAFEGCDAAPTAEAVNWMHHPEAGTRAPPWGEEESRCDFPGGQHRRRMGSRKAPRTTIWFLFNKLRQLLKEM